MIRRLLNSLAVAGALVIAAACTIPPALSASTTHLAVDDNGWPVQALAIGTATKVAYTGTNADSATFDKTKASVIVRVVCTTNCHIICNSATPTATTSHTLLVALVPEYFRVISAFKCSFVRNTADGDAYITEMD